MKLRVATTCLFAFVTAVSCKSDATGPGDLGFPELSETLRTEYCVRGNATVGQTKSGAISATDCDDGFGYYETYVVRVATSGSVTFRVSSGFDSYLILVRVESYTATAFTETFLDADDDSAGSLDAQLSFTLQPGVNYVISVSGLSYGDVGSYTLSIE